MGIIIKHSLKNIFARPLRLLVLLVCIVFASFAALLAFDMSNNIQTLLKGYAMQMVGKMDILVSGSSNEILDGVEDSYAINKVGISFLSEYEYSKDPTFYAYSFEETIDVYSFTDMNEAYALSLLPDSAPIDDTTAIINRDYADAFGKDIGDTITLETRDENEIELTIVDIIDVSNQIINGNVVIVTPENTRLISCTRTIENSIWMIDVLDDNQVQDVVTMLKGNDPKAQIQSMDDMMRADGIEQINNLFYLLFLISFLLVVFVTMSLAEKIVNERMSVIGTLRSLGVRRNKTAFILLIENIMYALLGTTVGSLLYSGVKESMFTNMFTLQSADGQRFDAGDYIGNTPWYVYLFIFIGAILIESAYPLYELLKAVKTPIRDIIFNNKDTEFKYTWTRMYAGIILLVICLVTGFLNKNFITLAVSLVTGITALAVLVPYMIKVSSRLLSSLFRKHKMPVAQLASENISRNKIIMGTAVLCITSMILSLLISSIGTTLKKELVTPDYNCNILVTVYQSDEDHDYRFVTHIDGVEAADYIYSTSLYGAIGESNSTYLQIISDTEHSLLTDLPSEGFGLADNEVVLSESKADSLGLSIGDEVEITLNPDTDFPSTLVLTLADTMDTSDTAMISTSTVIINSDLNEHLFQHALGNLMINADDPELVKELIENNTQTSIIEIKTMNDLIEEYETQSKGLIGVLVAVVIGSISLTLIGIAGNQALGFMTRKRELALLYSVALGRKKLYKLIFLESLFSIGLSSLFAALATPILYNILGHLLKVITEGDLNILKDGVFDSGSMIKYYALILFVFMLTTLIPFKELRKMKISEELKYE